MAFLGHSSTKLVFQDRATGISYIAAAFFDTSQEVVVCDFLCGTVRIAQLRSAKLFEEYETPTEAFKQHLKKLLEKYHDLKHCDGPCNG